MVLDASVALAWCFEDEGTPETEALHERLLLGGEEVLVPGIWWAEVGSGLLAGERRGRITGEWTARCLEMLRGLKVSGREVAVEAAVSLARQLRLSVYDASYLALAGLDDVELATLDGKLRTAAGKYGVKLQPGRKP